MNYKKIHFIGIGGIGVSALARYFLLRGVRVSGSDVKGSLLIDELKEKGVDVHIGHAKENVPDDVDVVVHTIATAPENSELKEAQKRRVPVLTYPQMLGYITEGKQSIAVSGTNGKTTTTALAGKIFEQAGKDPSVVVGGQVPGWEGNFRNGESNIFIAEACEYRGSMLELSPKTIVLTNIEEDHLDYFSGIEDILLTFERYVTRVSENGTLVWNHDDVYTKKLLERVSVGHRVSYGMSPEADLSARNIMYKNGHQLFELYWHGDSLGEFVTPLPGVFNVYNILAASALALEYGIDPGDIRVAVREFKGTWRRFEHVGFVGHTRIISDYAHHPTAVSAIIDATKDFYDLEKVLFVFQPHQKDRTRKLFDDFVRSFKDARHLVISEIYDVKGREEEGDKISSRQLVEDVSRAYKQNVKYSADLQNTEKIIQQTFADFDAVIFMGAGDIDSVARHLAKKGDI